MKQFDEPKVVVTDKALYYKCL
nr:hypothetical protein [Enterococcus faecium]